ncbi:MAG: hypothetical protein ABSG16_23045 [Candidatus Acidiferrum sp.]|jgi:hypothetical protein
MAFAPDHESEPVQADAFVDDHVSVELLPLTIALGPTLKLTVGAEVEAATVTVVD